MKQKGMLVLSLTGLISDVWSRLDCSGQNIKNYILVFMASFSGHEKLGPLPDWSLSGG